MRSSPLVRLAPDGLSASAADESGTPPTPRCSPPRPTAITACAIVPEYPNELTPPLSDSVNARCTGNVHATPRSAPPTCGLSERSCAFGAASSRSR